MEQAFFGAGIDRVGGDADARRYPHLEPGVVEPDGLANQFVQAAGDVQRIFLRGLRKQDHKFVAAVAEREIDQAAVRLQRVADFGEQARTDQVAVGVVDLLEVIEVDEHERKFVVVALRTVDFGFENEAHVARVVERRAIVGDGQFVDALDVARIFERDGSEIGQRFEQFQVARIEAVGADAIDQLDDAEAGVAKFDRHGDDRLRFHLGLFVDLAEEARVFGGVGHDDSFAVLRDPPGDALADLDAHIFQRLGCFADRQLKIKFLGGFVEKQQRPVVGPQKLVDLFHDGAENLVELQRGGERLAKFLEDRDFASFALFEGNAGIAAAFDGGKLFNVLHVRVNLFL